MTTQPYIRTCKRLVVYGCSFGWNGAIKPNIPWKIEGSWPDIVAKHFEMPLVHCCIVGTGPDWQYDQIMQDQMHGYYNRQTNQPVAVEPDDCIIIQWSHANRIAGDAPEFNNLCPASEAIDSMSSVAKKIAIDYYKYIYTDYFAVARVIGYVHTIQNTVSIRTLHAFTDGRDFFVGQHNNANGAGLVLDGIDYIGANNEDFKKMYAPEQHLCNHPTELGHQIIANAYIKNLDLKY